MGQCLSRFNVSTKPSNVFASTTSHPSTQPDKKRRKWWRRARSAAIQDDEVWSSRVTKAATEETTDTPPTPVSGSRLLLPDGQATRIWV